MRHVLSIAGSDSGGGAGIQADLKTFAALGVYGMSAVTAVTAQNTREVRGVQPLPPVFVAAQIDAVWDDIRVDAVKIGMLHAPEIVQTVAEAIDFHALPNVVFDPVMVATSGAVLIQQASMDILVRGLFPRATLITPNLDEAGLLVGKPLTSTEDMEAAALTLRAQGARAVLVKGGHLPGDTVIDLLLTESGEKIWMKAPRIHSPNTHGTGCTLSSAIAAHLALGESLVEAVRAARLYVREALQAGAQVRTGNCGGPLNHSHSPVAMHLRPLQHP